MTEDDLTAFLASFRAVAELAGRMPARRDLPRFAAAVEDHLGCPPADVAVVTETIPNHRYADWDRALAVVAERDPQARVVGVCGGDARYHQKLADLVAELDSPLPVGQVDYVSVPVGPEQHRRAVGFGMRLFRYRDEAVGILQRAADRRYGVDVGQLEVICADHALTAALLAELRDLALRHSVLRGQVISLQSTGYGPEADGITFLERPSVSAEQVILPATALERIVTQVSGIADHAGVLRRHGQHLKRGLLLYGPPGTGKTHTVRHLISRTPGHTVIVLVGESLAYISLAAALARALAPAIVVLEDCDLVAEDREAGPSGRPLLFEVLDAMDGLDPDADVTFVLTTNRVEALERALVQRPGRIDLAVEVPLPDLGGRRRLLDLYRFDIAYAEDVLDDVAARTEGMTASFFKELVRRAVLDAAVRGEDPGDEHLLRALDQLLHSQEELTRLFLGAGGAESELLADACDDPFA